MNSELLATLDRVKVNLEKLERVWEKARPLLLATGTRLGNTPEYAALERDWNNLLKGLPPINGWTISQGLPAMEAISEVLDLNRDKEKSPAEVRAELERPGNDLTTYRNLLLRAKGEATALRLAELSTEVAQLIDDVVTNIPSPDDGGSTLSGRQARIETPAGEQIETYLDELERLLGPTVERSGRWSEMRRHLRFGEPHDWREIAEIDWPSVASDIEEAKVGDADPIPVPAVDLGVYSGKPATDSGLSMRISSGGSNEGALSPAVGLPGGLNSKEHALAPMGDRIFIVHGRDESAKNEVAYFLSRLTGIEPVILHEQRNIGKSLIEKLENAANQVNFAVVLLTADDEAKAKEESGFESRARQNVVFEMGYFMALLGRERVAVLRAHGVKEPGDTHGMLYIPYGPFDHWKGKLAGELDALGIKVDPQVLMK